MSSAKAKKNTKPQQAKKLTKPQQLKAKFDKFERYIHECDGPREHQSEISEILLWIAINQPGALKKGSLSRRMLDYCEVKRLYFRESWVNPNEPLPTDAIIALLKSCLCGELTTFCGFINPDIVENFKLNKPLIMRLALSKKINVQTLLQKLKERRLKQFNNKKYKSEDELTVHLRSCELDLKDLETLPDLKPTLYITDVKDADADWVVKAAVALKPEIDPAMSLDPKKLPKDQKSYPYIESLHLPQSKLTAAGVEAIAKGLFEAGISLSAFTVSNSSYIQVNQNIKDFCAKISEKYSFKKMSYACEESEDFEDYAHYIDEGDSWEDNKYMNGWGTYGTTLQGGY